MERGTVCLVVLDPAMGHEQKGARPCVIVSSPEVSAHQRFPIMAVVPITGREGKGALYPALQVGDSGLRKQSWAMTDQIRTVDKRRVRRVFGCVNAPELKAIDEGLRLFLSL